MPQHYPITALSATIYCANRPTLRLTLLFNKFAVSDMVKNAQRHVEEPRKTDLAWWKRPPYHEKVRLYLAERAAPFGPSPALSAATMERRLSRLVSSYAQCGFAIDRKNCHIATVLAGIKRKHAHPPV